MVCGILCGFVAILMPALLYTRIRYGCTLEGAEWIPCEYLLQMMSQLSGWT
jgi:hypothetical protein